MHDNSSMASHRKSSVRVDRCTSISTAQPADGDAVDLLTHVSNFSGVTERCAMRGESLFIQGQQADAVFFVQFGLVRLSQTLSNGREVTLGLSQVSSILGGAAALCGMEHSSTATAVTSISVLAMSRAAFCGAMETYSDFHRAVHLLHCRQLIQQTEHIALINGGDTTRRIAHFLLKCVEGKTSANTTIATLPFSRSEFARLIGVSPEHLCRVLNRLNKDRLVIRKGKQLFIPNVRRLELISG